MKKSTMRSNLQGLQGLAETLEAMKEKRVQVGIFGAKSARNEAVEKKSGKGRRAGSAPDVLTNAEVAAKNELGSYSENIPKRSFLRMPLFTHGEDLLKNAQADVKRLVAEGKGRVNLIYKRLGIAAEAVVQTAFKTRGWGTWKPNAPMTIAEKGSDAPLIDTAQLRRAVASRVV